MRTPRPTPEEIRVLKNHKRKAPEILVQAKAEAILLAADGVSMGIIADFTDREESTVAQWLGDWAAARLASVVTGHGGNLNASKLTESQRAEVAAHLARPPSPDGGSPAAFWDVPKLASWLSTRFAVVYESPSSHHFLLRFAGLTFHKPEPFDKRGDETPAKSRMAEIRAEVAALGADPAWEVFAADEVRLGQEADIRRAWIPAASKAVVKVERRRETRSHIGFLNQRDGTCELERLDWKNAEQVLAALARLVWRHPGKKICLAWDNAAWHKNKLSRTQLSAGGVLEKARLIAMPPNAPDHNPIEHVWKAAKDHAPNLQHENLEDTAQQFEQLTANRKFNHKLYPPRAFDLSAPYFPYPAKTWVNGHEWTRLQGAKAGIGFKELSNGFAATDDHGRSKRFATRWGQSRSRGSRTGGWPVCPYRWTNPTGRPGIGGSGRRRRSRRPGRSASPSRATPGCSSSS